MFLMFLNAIKIVSFEKLGKYGKTLLLAIIPVVLFWLMFHIIMNQINNHSGQLVIDALKEVQQTKMQQNIDGIYREIFQVLGEPILTIGLDNKLQVANS